MYPGVSEQGLQGEGEEKTVQEVLDVFFRIRCFMKKAMAELRYQEEKFYISQNLHWKYFLQAKEEGLHTCCETTGFVKTETFKTIIEQVDYLLFDMKHWDSQRHKEEQESITN